MFKTKTFMMIISAIILTVSILQTHCFSAPTPYIIISPSKVTLKTSQTQIFTATVSDGSYVNITWSVKPSNGGQITSNGRYTAPSTPGNYTVEAKGPSNLKIGAGRADVKVVADTGEILRYGGSVTLTRKMNRNGKVIDETIRYENLILKSDGDDSNPSYTNITGSARVTVQNKEGTTTTYASQNVANVHFSLVLTIDKTGKDYTISAGDLTNINAKITSNGSVSYSPITIMGQSAANLALPANLTRISGHKFITESSGAQVQLVWSFTEKP